MIKVVMRSTISIDDYDYIISIYEKLIQATRNESGCISYELYQDVYHKNRIALIEEWESKNDLVLHTKTAHFIKFTSILSNYEVEEEALLYEKIL